MARQRLCRALIAALATAVCVVALATPAAARSPGAIGGSYIDASDPLLAGLELDLEGVAHVKRHLLQLPSGTVTYAPCNAAREHTCGPTAAAASGAKSICCNKSNFACSNRADNGQPLCSVCPQTCIYACGSGWVCGKKDGCFKCIKEQCSATLKCPGGQVCDTRTPGGACIPDPCNAKSACPANAPVCTVSSSMAKVCSPTKKKEQPLRIAPVKMVRRLAANSGSAGQV